MSRYIDADEVLEQIRKKLGIKSLDYLLEAERQIVDAIQSAPSIDVPTKPQADVIGHRWKLKWVLEEAPDIIEALTEREGE